MTPTQICPAHPAMPRLEHAPTRPEQRPWASRPALAMAATVLLLGVGSAPATLAAEGLSLAQTEQLWPSLRARITLQTAAISPLKLADWGRLLPAQGDTGLTGGAVLGDYVFAQPSFGSFRATSGLVFGAQGRVPHFGVASFSAGSRLGLALGTGGAQLGSLDEAWQATPYLGLGFSSPLGDSGFSLSADLGWLAESPATVGQGGSGLRLRSADPSRRDLRLSPLLQFGMRYTF